MRWLRRLLAAVVGGTLLLAVLAALPALLVVIVRAVDWDWRALVAEPMSALSVVAVLVGAGWLVWLAAVWAVAADVVAALRAGPSRVARLPVPLHTAVTAAVGGVLLALHAARGGTATAAVAPPAAAPTAAPTTTPTPVPADGVRPGTVWADAGVFVPGGWLPWPVTAALSAALTLVWVHRRRWYTPRPPTGWQDHDPDLPAPGDAELQLLSVTHQAADRGPEPADTTPISSWPADGSADADHGPPMGETTGAGGPRELVAAWLPGGVLGLAGPGRYDAARGLLIALLVQPSDLRPRIVCSSLFAATVLETGQQTIDVPSTNDPDLHGGSGTVLFAVGPELADTAALTAPTGDAGSAVDLDPVTAVRADSTIQVTASGHGSTWHVDDDGATRAITGAAPRMRRLPVLDQTATTTILTSLGLLARPSIADGSGPARTAAAARDPAVAAGEPVAWPDQPPGGAGQPRRLQIRVLGEPQVLCPHPDGIDSPVQIRRSAGRQLLVLLALHRDGVAADVLKEAIWPDVPSSTAHRRFLTTMSELGRVLHDAAGQPVLRHDDPAASLGPARYRLDPAAAQVDIWQLQDVLVAAVTCADPAARQGLLREAAALDGVSSPPDGTTPGCCPTGNAWPGGCSTSTPTSPTPSRTTPPRCACCTGRCCWRQATRPSTTGFCSGGRRPATPTASAGPPRR
ncbi:AfsR/SARP family transcriptional regulator [Dactylosporangium darangshiense]|uniref:AfsR/SARP family transcriptional regulator n=1 Tax=Dactylosporangium darangshiense TaxID=579108 RepID=UPI00363B5366